MFDRSTALLALPILFVSSLGLAEAAKRSIRVGEMVFDARVEGPEDGPLVLLLHGFPETSFAYRHQLEWLGDEGYRAVAFDQRGYSKGARPEGVEHYAMGALVDDVLKVADALGHERFHLVGHDWGGAVAWVTALRHPERLISLTVIATPHVGALAAARADGQSDQAARSAYMKDFASEGAERSFLADDATRLRALFEGSGMSASEVQVCVDALGTADAMQAALNWYRASALTRGAGSSASSEAPVSIRVPTLYVWGSEDRAFGRDAAEATARYVAGPYRFVPLDGIGHWVMEQATDRLDPLLREHLRRWQKAEELEVSTLPLSQELRSNGRLGGVSVGQDGSIYVSNFGATVWKISPQGKVETLTRSLRGSSGNTIDREGSLLQASFLDGRIVRFTPGGEMTTLVEEGLEGPVGLAADGDGNVFVCNCRGGTISRVDRRGEASTFARSERFQCPNGITFGPEGALYVVSFDNGHVVRVDREGGASLVATLPEGGNAHITYARGSFFVTKIESNRVYRLFDDGRFELFAGTGVLGLRDGSLAEATLSRPNGIAASSDGDWLYLNNLVGEWRGDEETTIVLRRIRIGKL